MLYITMYHSVNGKPYVRICEYNNNRGVERAKDGSGPCLSVLALHVELGPPLSAPMADAASGSQDKSVQVKLVLLGAYTKHR